VDVRNAVPVVKGYVSLEKISERREQIANWEQKLEKQNSCLLWSTAFLGFAVVCPITNQVKGYPFEVPVPNGSVFTGVVLTDQIKTFDWNARNFQFKGEATPEFVQECLDYVHTYL
jgi:N-glycosylase/DNA lyase